MEGGLCQVQVGFIYRERERNIIKRTIITHLINKHARIHGLMKSALRCVVTFVSLFVLAMASVSAPGLIQERAPLRTSEIMLAC